MKVTALIKRKLLLGAIFILLFLLANILMYKQKTMIMPYLM
jgi:hypothetical protein